jgi:hypothetical protein
MDTKKELDAEFEAYLQRNGITGVWTQKHIDAFWNEREQAKRDYPAFTVDHPEFVDSDANHTKLTKWLDVMDLPGTLENLDRAFHALRKNLELQKVEPPPDLNKPEMRPGRWKNGVFIPDPHYVEEAETTYAQHSPQFVNVGQADPSKAASSEATPRKAVKNMTAGEYLYWLNSSPSFQKKMDKS